MDPLQWGAGVPGGAEQLVHLIRLLIFGPLIDTHGLAAIDSIGAFDTISRQEMVIFAHEAAEGVLHPLAALAYGEGPTEVFFYQDEGGDQELLTGSVDEPPPDIEAERWELSVQTLLEGHAVEGGAAWTITSEEGGGQGEPDMPPLYCGALRKGIRSMAERFRDLRAGDTSLRTLIILWAYMDDIFVLAPFHLFEAALQIVKEELALIHQFMHVAIGDNPAKSRCMAPAVGLDRWGVRSSGALLGSLCSVPL